MTIEKYIECPQQFEFALDNGGYTLDRYTIQLTWENGNSLLIASCGNPAHPQGVWSISEATYIVLDEIEENDVHLGEEIEWDELPTKLKEAIIGYIPN